MPRAVSTEILDEVAVIRIDNPPVNALSNDVIAGIHAEVAKAAADPAARAIVIVGAGRTFVAGADIKGLEGMAWGDLSGAPDMHDTFKAIEDCAKPVVMAMHGTALGGGLELAMAGHYRVAAGDARLGQPEVNLGIIPGAEGTQRLPRLVGVEKALEMCVSGRPIAADDALRAGLIEWIVEGDLVAGAVVPGARESRPAGWAAPDARAHRQAARPRCAAGHARSGPSAGRQDEAAPGGAASRRGRNRRGRHAAFRGRAPARARAVLPLRAVRAGQGPDLRVLRRAHGRQGAGAARRAASAGEIGGHRRRRDDGRRHRHGLRQRGPGRHPDRYRAGLRGQRPCHDYQELRDLGYPRPSERRRRGRAAEPHHGAGRRGGLSRRGRRD